MNVEKSAAELRRLVAGARQLLRHRRELLDVAAALVEHLELEAAERAEALDRRRQERQHDARR